MDQFFIRPFCDTFFLPLGSTLPSPNKYFQSPVDYRGQDVYDVKGSVRVLF